MTLQDWGALGELIGGVAIIVSLIYVGLQIKQSTAATRSATNQAFSTQYSDVMFKLTEANFRDIFWRGIGGLENLKGSEQAAFFGYVGAITRMYESFQIQEEAGTFDTQLFESWMNQVVDLYGHPGAQDYWKLRKHQFTPKFIEFLEAELATRNPKPMYKPEPE